MYSPQEKKHLLSRQPNRKPVLSLPALMGPTDHSKLWQELNALRPLKARPIPGLTQAAVEEKRPDQARWTPPAGKEHWPFSRPE
ncbi:hypothetical protein AA0312_1867 [Acetobacter tropicalis NRIC 0312]|nr:hypothetical protein ATR1_048d0077 [Acetobacter tropicalis]GBR70481.1 hypothetical protein AA0312_1867 [Acetobacter tropicalis NRIC 0312]